MTLFACGINHKTAPIALREKLVFNHEQLPAALASLGRVAGVHEAIILSTCNRTEIYCVADDATCIFNWVAAEQGINQAELSHCWMVYDDAQAVRHIMRVACGLDSMVLGEPQILGQMKHAFAKACYAYSVGAYLERLMPRVFQAAKKVRTNSEIGACPVSLASMAVKLAKQQVDNLELKTILLVGAGETIALTARHLFADGMKQFIIASRHIEKAECLAEQFSGQAIEIKDLYETIPKADVVMTATASSLPIITRGALEKVRPQAPLLIVDMAVPRDVEPEVGALSHISLFSIDDMKAIIHENMRNQAHAANKAEEVVKQCVNDFLNWMNSLDAGSIITAYRNHIEQLRDEEVAKALTALQKGVAPEKVIQTLARDMGQKFLHKPSVNMRKAGYDGRLDLLELTYLLFDIDQ